MPNIPRPRRSSVRPAVGGLLLLLALSGPSASATPVLDAAGLRAQAVTDCTAMGGTVAEDDGDDVCRVTGTVTLSAERTVRTFPIVLDTSGATLECRGATLVNAGKSHIGVLVESRDPAAPPEGLTVRDCRMRGFLHSVMVRTGLARGEIGTLSRTGEPGHRRIRAASPRGVVLSGLTSTDSRRVGIYIGPGVVGATLEKSTVEANRGGPGVYLDFSSSGNRILGNTIRRTQREGLAVDSSYDNLIRGNTFETNRDGGVFLYRNCQEKARDVRDAYPNARYFPNAALRIAPASGNVIENNRFVDEKTGVWIASRQTRNLASWGCGIAPYYEGPDARGGHVALYPDAADRTVVRGNRFVRGDVGVQVESPANRIEDNDFRGTDTGILVGTRNGRLPKAVVPPPTGVVADDNRFEQVSDPVVGPVAADAPAAAP